MQTIYLKQAKIFLSSAEGAEQRFLAPVGGPVQAPDWIVNTDTYKLGVKDGAIVDLTPPKQHVVDLTEPAAEEEEAELVTTVSPVKTHTKVKAPKGL